MNPKITPEHLRRGAIVYVRQSTIGQVVEHSESKRRQYALADSAQELGFASVSVIDDDLGRSGSGLVERPGFQKLVAAVCGGSVGSIFCIEASRLARNGRDWHHLIDLCALVNSLVIDGDGVYDPRLINDRLLLGLKGTMSEYELSLLRRGGLRPGTRRLGAVNCASHCPQVIVGMNWGGSKSIPTSASRRRFGYFSASSKNWEVRAKSSFGREKPR